MNPLTDEARWIVERVRLFLRWKADDFDDLRQPKPTIERPVGWLRSYDGGKEWCISAAVWRDLLHGDGLDPVRAAQTLIDLKLLRQQNHTTIQVTVNVRGKSERAYAVSDAILAWNTDGLQGLQGRGARATAGLNLCLTVTDDGKVIVPPQYQAKWSIIAERARRFVEMEYDRAEAWEAEAAKLRELLASAAPQALPPPPPIASSPFSRQETSPR